MATQLVPYAPPSAPVMSVQEVQTVAEAIARGGLFGSKDPYAVLTLCLLAQAEGQHPAVVFRDYHIISGKPAKKAEAMQRDFLASGGKIEWHKLTDDECEATFSHPAGGSATINWDKARVKQAQIGGNAMHGKYPRQMLRSRVISEGVRTVFPGATSGLYESSEVADMVTQDAPARPAPPQAKRARDLTPEPKPDDKRAKAEDWVAKQLAAVEEADTVEALDEVITTGNGAVRKLAKEHADLHGRVQSAYEARQQALQGYDTDTGEVTTTEPHPLSARIAAATTRDELNACSADLAKARGAMDEDVAAGLDSAITEAMNAMGEG